MRPFLLLLFFIFSLLSTSAMETKGKLEVDTSKTQGAIVGESYPAVLTLVPVEEEIINKQILENSLFLDYFYITRVQSIQRSENNSDALVVEMDLVLVKNFENQTFKIWPLGLSNIPVSFDIGKVEKTELLIKDFIQFETSLAALADIDWKVVAVIIIIFIIGLLAYKWLRRRNLVRSNEIVNFERELKISTKHSDFEWIYRNRKILNSYLENKPQAKVSFDELNAAIGEYQFRPGWKSMDISELISKKKKVVEYYKNGI